MASCEMTTHYDQTPSSDACGEGSEDYGGDLSLLRWTLSLTPLERLEQMERAARDTRVLNELGKRNEACRTR
jgi:hypothetical protein